MLSSPTKQGSTPSITKLKEKPLLDPDALLESNGLNECDAEFHPIDADMYPIDQDLAELDDALDSDLLCEALEEEAEDYLVTLETAMANPLDFMNWKEEERPKNWKDIFEAFSLGEPLPAPEFDREAAWKSFIEESKPEMSKPQFLTAKQLMKS